GNEEARILTNMGVLYRHLGDPVKALEAYQQARKRFIQWRHVAGEIGVLRNVGILQSASVGDHEAAVKTFSEAIELAQKTGNKRTEMQGRLYRAEARRLLGNIDDARLDFEASLEGARSLGAAEEQWKSLFGLGKIAEAQGQKQEARQLFESSLSIIESLRARLSLSSLRPGFLADKRAVYDAMISSAFSGRPDQQITASVLGLMERARARTFQDSLGKSIEVIQKRRAPEATKRLKDVREQLTALLPRQLAASRPDHQLVAEYNRLENEYTRVENEISQEVPLGSALPPELKAVQQALGPARVDLLVEYWLGDGYLAWVWATPTEAGTGSSRPLPPQMLSDCLASLSDPNEVGWRSKCREASQLLLQPIRERSLPSGRRIVIVPDGILQSVPFEVLEMPGGRLLIEQAAVHYVPSAGVLLDRPSDRGWSSRAPWSESLVALGNPVAVKASPAGSFETWEALPHSEEEVLAVARLLPGRKSVHLGAGARKQELPWTGGKSAPILHLATHSTIDLESPDRSRIIFSGTPQTGPFDYLFLRE
ncbi:MAG: CHAT domain-containing protein, partial [Acidobacteria bacterium]